MYFFASQYWRSRWAGLLSALLWSWAPPIFEKIFIGGALGEITSYIFIPLTFLCLYNLIQKPNFKRSLYLSFSTAFWIFSHLLTPIIFSPLLIIFLIFQLKQVDNSQKALKFLAISGFFTFGLIAWFIIPIIFEMQFTHFKDFVQHEYATQFVSLKRLLYSKWGTNAPGWGDNPVSQQVGIAQWLAIGLAGLTWLKSKKSLVLPFLLSFGLSIFLMLKISSPIWSLPTPLQNVGTPWRFLSLAVFTSAVLAGSLTTITKYPLIKNLLLILLIFLALYGNRNHLRVNQKIIYNQEFFQNYTGVATGWNEHLPIWIKDIPKAFPEKKVEIIEGNCEISNQHHQSNLHQFAANCTQPSTVQLNVAYYPRWKTYINDQDKSLEVFKNLNESNGMIRFSIDTGKNQIKAIFGNKWLSFPPRQ